MSDLLDWPGTSQAGVAFATRVVLLSKASKTCSLKGTKPEHEQLLQLIAMATNYASAQGHTFAEFLKTAKEKLALGAHEYGLDGPAAATLADIAQAEPVDLIGKLFDELVELASGLYGRRLTPTLIRSVMATGDFRRKKAIEGKVLRGSNEIELLIYYNAGFDLTALALVPRILAHELICHVGARYVGVWRKRPDPDVREYFTDGFMDRATFIYLNSWFPYLSRLTSVGQLGAVEWRDSAERPHAFHAGAAAFDNCKGETAKLMRPASLAELATRSAQLEADWTEASLNAAVRMNMCGSHIMEKDWFVHHACVEGSAHTSSFARVAKDDDDPGQLFDPPH